VAHYIGGIRGRQGTCEVPSHEILLTQRHSDNFIISDFQARRPSASARRNRSPSIFNGI
jgi:hypothetical protein